MTTFVAQLNKYREDATFHFKSQRFHESLNGHGQNQVFWKCAKHCSALLCVAPLLGCLLVSGPSFKGNVFAGSAVAVTGAGIGIRSSVQHLSLQRSSMRFLRTRGCVCVWFGVPGAAVPAMSQGLATMTGATCCAGFAMVCYASAELAFVCGGFLLQAREPRPLVWFFFTLTPLLSVGVLGIESLIIGHAWLVCFAAVMCYFMAVSGHQAATDGDTHAAAILERSETLSSPLCRAVVTGHLALPRSSSRHLVTLLPDGREQCMMAVFARDSEGTPRSKIESRVLEELGELGVTSDTLDLSLEQMPSEKWWVVHEDDASIRARADRLLRDLYSESERQTTIFVGHSRSVRQLFRSFGGEFKASQLGAQFATTAVQNCAVLLVSLARGSEDETPSIVGAEFLFGTTFASH